MKIALQAYTLRDYRSYKPGALGAKEEIKTLLWRVAKAGYEGIEMGTPVGYTHEEYKALLDEFGLQCITARGVNYPSLDRAEINAAIEECKALGAKNTMAGMGNIMLGNTDEITKYIKFLNELGKILMEEAGIHLSYHNHAIEFSKVNGVTTMQRLIEETDERYVFFEPDTHWIQAGGGHVISWLKKLAGRMYVVHFKDYAIDQYSDHEFLECTHRQFAEIGEGNMNWPGIITECKAQNIKWCVVEQDLVPNRPVYEAIALSVKNLRAFGV
jgi:Sugar phosphate isomerases/epimerases